jgi:predicted esterase
MDDAGGDTVDRAGPRLPPMPSECPAIKTGTVTVMGQRVQLWVGAKQAGKRGPILFYWHDIESSTIEAQSALGRGNGEILAEGGVIASFDTSTSKGQNTGSNWYTGDFAMADTLLACAIAQQDVDPRRIHTAGCGGGGMQASAMVYARSGYLASAMANSGGTPFPYQFEDASHIPAFIGAHGAQGRDKVVLDFAETTARQVSDLVAKGGFAVQCDHGGDHCATPTSFRNAQWQFLKDHPFGVDPEPYSEGLPADFPAVCKIGN